MNQYRKIHISIGSNLGDKLKNIEKAIELIHLRIAIIQSISVGGATPKRKVANYWFNQQQLMRRFLNVVAF